MPEKVPSAATASSHCLRIASSSSLTVIFWPGTKPERLKDTLPPAATEEPAVMTIFGAAGAGRVTVRAELLTLVPVARKRSQCSPASVPSGTVTLPEKEPSEPVVNWPIREASSSLTLSFASAGKPLTRNARLSPARTEEDRSSAAGTRTPKVTGTTVSGARKCRVCVPAAAVAGTVSEPETEPSSPTVN